METVGTLTIAMEPNMANWKTLPEDLRYLIQPAEHFGNLRVHEELLSLINSISKSETQQLERVAQQIRSRHHRASMLQWLDESDGTEAGDLLYGLMGVLDEFNYDLSPSAADNESEASLLLRQWREDHISSFVGLAVKSQSVLPFHVAREAATQALKRVPQNKLYAKLLVLECFPTPDNQGNRT